MLLAACGKQAATTTATSSATPSGSYSHSVAMSSSSIYSWGGNVYGQLGDGNITARATPGPVLAGAAATTGDLTGMNGVSAGGTHTLAFVVNGHVYAWGNNFFGELGNNTIVASTIPVKVLDGTTTTTAPYPTLTGITAVAAGGDQFSLALQGSTVLAWGNNSLGQLGLAALTPAFENVAKQVHSPLPVNITMIAAGGDHSLALDGVGNVWSWGSNRAGQLGQGQVTINIPTPGMVVTLTEVVIQIAAGGSHSLFVTVDGKVWACGLNDSGELGDGHTVNQNSVVQVTGLPALAADGITPIKPFAVAAGLNHSLALMSDNTVWAWGDNTFGQLGNVKNFNNGLPVTSPVQVKKVDGNPLQNVTKIVAIGNSNLAIMDDGINPPTLWAWGEGTYGQLGNGTTATSRYAVEVTGIPTPDLYVP